LLMGAPLLFPLGYSVVTMLTASVVCVAQCVASVFKYLLFSFKLLEFY
jgi:hypothetical protein